MRRWTNVLSHCLLALSVLAFVGCEAMAKADTAKYQAAGAAAADLAYATLDISPTFPPKENTASEPLGAIRGDAPLEGPPTDNGEALVEAVFRGSQAMQGEPVPVLAKAGEIHDGIVEHIDLSDPPTNPPLPPNVVETAEPATIVESVQVCGPEGMTARTVEMTPVYSEGYRVKRGLFGKARFVRSRGGRSCGAGGCR